MPSIGVKKQLLKPSTATLGNQSRNAEQADSSSYGVMQHKTYERYKMKRNALQAQDSSQERNAQALAGGFQASPRLAAGGRRHKFDGLRAKSFANDPVARFYSKKMKLNMQSLDHKSSNYLSLREQRTDHLADVPRGERSEASFEQAQPLRPQHAPKMLSPLHKSKEELAQLQALPNYRTSFGHHANDLGSSALLLPNNKMINKALMEPLSVQSASLD